MVGRRQARPPQQPDHGDDRAWLQLGALISGAIVTEQIFGIAGFGRLTVDSIARDYALLQGVVLVVAIGYVVVNLLVDLLYSFINPRIRVAGTST